MADQPALHAVPLPDTREVGANRAEIKDWLRLCHTPGVPPAAVRRLLTAFGMPEAIFRASRARLAEVLPDALVARLLAPMSTELSAQIARTRDWAGQPGCAVVTLSEPAYPRALLALGDAPPILYCRGDVGLPNRAGGAAVALVGSRRATPQGRDNARHFARTLGDAGVMVVSGLAAGIDAAAHEGALVTTGGTCAVVGTGADLVYPARHRALAERIAERGLLLSAFPVGTPPRADHFPRRNRLIAALAQCIVVVEATTHSGSLITARLAGDLGRDVLAVPGSIHAPQSRGCHTLIRDGATLATSPEDVFEALGIAPPAGKVETVAAVDTIETTAAGSSANTKRSGDARASARGARASRRQPSASATTDLFDVHDDGRADGPPSVRAEGGTPSDASSGMAAVLEALGYDPVSADTLCGRTGLAITAILAHLSVLELDGHIARLPGGRFARRIDPGVR